MLVFVISAEYLYKGIVIKGTSLLWWHFWQFNLIQHLAFDVAIPSPFLFEDNFFFNESFKVNDEVITDPRNGTVFEWSNPVPHRDPAHSGNLVIAFLSMNAESILFNHAVHFAFLV